MPVWDIVANPFNRKEAIIATELGIFQCADVYATSPTWTPIQEGMGAVKTMMLDYNVKDGVIMAATHGRGFFTSDAWTKLDPVAYFSLKDSVICESQSLELIDSSLNTENTRKWNISPASFKFTNGSDSSSKTAKVQFDKAGEYTIELIVTNAGMESKLTRKITVNPQYLNNLTLNPSNTSYCENEDLTLTANILDKNTQGLANAALQWFRNGAEISANLNKMTLLIKAPLINKDEYEIKFTADYACLTPKSASSTYTLNTSPNSTLNITRVWDTLFSNYNGSGTVEWYRNGFKIGTGTKYKLIDNGEFYARVVNGNCNGSKSNIIQYQSLGSDNLKNRIQIGPNPNLGLLSIQTNWLNPSKAKIISLNGEIISDGIIILPGIENKIEMDYPDGIYFVEIVNELGQSVMEKIVLSH